MLPACSDAADKLTTIATTGPAMPRIDVSPRNLVQNLARMWPVERFDCALRQLLL